MVCDDHVHENTAKMSSDFRATQLSGHRRCKQTFTSMLHNPICDINKLRAHYDITEACLEDGIWKSIRDSLKDIKDLEKLSRKLVLKRFTPRDVAVLLDGLHKSVELRELVSSSPAIDKYLRNTCNVVWASFPLETLINFIETRITAEEAMGLDSCGFNQYSAECVNKGSCFVCEGVSEELDTACKGGLIWQQQLEAIVKYFDSLIANTETSSKSKGRLIGSTTRPPLCRLLLCLRNAGVLY